jgi:hypothetical protein
MLEEISFPSALKHKTDGANWLSRKLRHFCKIIHLDSNSDEHILLGIAGNPEKGTNDSLLRDCGNTGSCCYDPISTLSDSRLIGRLTS